MCFPPEQISVFLLFPDLVLYAKHCRYQTGTHAYYSYGNRQLLGFAAEQGWRKLLLLNKKNNMFYSHYCASAYNA